MRAFDIENEGRIVFGPGTEARTAERLAELGAERVLLVATARHRAGADRIAAQLGDRSVGVFDQARPHVPTAIVDEARSVLTAGRADWVLAHGGGTTTGLAKALALTEPVQIAAVPTTYAGSERTSIWGLTGPDGKRTGRDDRVKPALVVYDAELTVGLDRQISLQSLFNALSHCIAVLTHPASEAHADDAATAARQLLAAMDAVAADPSDLDARNEALYGAYLASASIERATLGLHHKLAHVLGGTFDAVHASAHTAVLPYSLHFNAEIAPRLVEALEPVLGDDPAAALYDRARAWGLPHSLKELGLSLGDLPRFVDQLLVRPYENPRPTPREDLESLARDAYHARRPSRFSRRRRITAAPPHGAWLVTERGTPLDQAKAVLIAVHGRGAAADRIARDYEAHLEPSEGLCVLAPQATDNTWYPKGFTAPLAENQPGFDSALSVVDALWAAASDAVGADRVVLAGFSQGACVLLSWAKAREAAPAAVIAMSGAALDVDGTYANLATTRVVMSKSEDDPWIPQDRFAATAAELTEVPDLEVRLAPGNGHQITKADGADLAAVVAKALA